MDVPQIVDLWDIHNNLGDLGMRTSLVIKKLNDKDDLLDQVLVGHLCLDSVLAK